MAEDFLDNCDPPILPPTVGPGEGSGEGGGSGGGSSSGGRGGGGRGGRPTTTQPQEPTTQTPSRGAGGGGGGGGGAGGGGGVPSINCQPFSGPTLPTNKGKGWSETPTQYAKIKGKEIQPREIPCNCEGSDGEGSNEAERFKDVTIYPYNKVTETESGHVVEFDDTPGSERITTNHRSGTFEEYHPNGDKVIKVVRDSYTSILRNKYVHVDGYCDVTIDKALKILVNKDELENSEQEAVNFDIHIGKNANVNIYIEKGHLNVLMDEGDSNIQLKKGDVNIRQDDGHFNHFINGDYNLECTGHMHVVVGGDQVNEVGGNRDVRVDGDFDNLNMTKKGSVKETTLEGSMRTLVNQSLTEHTKGVTERKYYDRVFEYFQMSAERTYSNLSTLEKHNSLSINVGATIPASETGSLLEGDVTIYSTRSTFRADLDNYVISEQGNAGIRSYKDLFLECGSGKKGKSKESTIRMFSENDVILGARKTINLYSNQDFKISSKKNIWLFGLNKLYKNKEFEDGGFFSGEAAPTLLKINANIGKDPRIPINFIYCDPGKWTPTNQK